MFKQNLPDYIEQFIIDGSTWEPCYASLSYEEIDARVDQALEMLMKCRVCPRHCAVNRLRDEPGVCASGRYASVSSAFPHHGEEDCLRGWRGSGTIFFTHCNLKCVFCQNFDISRLAQGGKLCDAEELAGIILRLQKIGCHNINFVTPEHVVPQVLEGISVAIKGGLHLPIVYNTSAYDSLESLALLNGIVDIYMPDFKIWDPILAQKYLKASDYPEVARKALLEMWRQVGPLTFDNNGIALRGVLIRHLVMPGMVEDSKKILQWLREKLGPDVYVNIMDQYHPAGLVSLQRYPEICRPVSASEYREVVEFARSIGLWRIDTRWRGFVIMV